MLVHTPTAVQLQLSWAVGADRREGLIAEGPWSESQRVEAVEDPVDEAYWLQCSV